MTDSSGNATYRMVPTTPPVDPSEVDAAEAAVEIVVLWGETSVLHVEHLSPPRVFSVGDAVDARGKRVTDFLIGRESLGTDLLPVTLASDAGASVFFPAGASGDLAIGDRHTSLDLLVARGAATASMRAPGAHECALEAGATARVSYRGFTFVVKTTSAARRVGVGGPAELDWKAWTWGAASLAAHVALLLLFYAVPPRASALSMDRFEADSRFVKTLIEPPETVDEAPVAPGVGPAGTAESDAGKAHAGDPGRMGKRDAPATRRRFAIPGPKENPDPHMARDEARRMALEGGLIGTLKRSVGAWDSPTSPYGRDQALGNDPTSALAAIMGDFVGENFGIAGLAPTGTGRGSNGTGEGTIGVGPLGTIGHDPRLHAGGGYGSQVERLGVKPDKVPPRVRPGKADVRGALGKEVIQRVIRRHLNEVRSCYEEALIARPDLAGRVSVQFIISPGGSVQTAAVAQTDLGHVAAEACIANAVRRWTFPSPEGGGVVVVTYPFVLAQVGR